MGIILPTGTRHTAQGVCVCVISFRTREKRMPPPVICPSKNIHTHTHLYVHACRLSGQTVIYQSAAAVVAGSPQRTRILLLLSAISRSTATVMNTGTHNTNASSIRRVSLLRYNRFSFGISAAADLRDRRTRWTRRRRRTKLTRSAPVVRNKSRTALRVYGSSMLCARIAFRTRDYAHDAVDASGKVCGRIVVIVLARRIPRWNGMRRPKAYDEKVAYFERHVSFPNSTRPCSGTPVSPG